MIGYAKNMVLLLLLEVETSLILLTGDIIYMTAFGRGIIILGSRKGAVDLLDKRAVNFSDRAALPMNDM
jgi:hypothetical protein